MLMYQGVRPRAFRKALSHVPTGAPTSLFVDLGCGKGRALLLAASAGFRRVVGVEICADLARIAERNASVWSRAPAGAEIWILNRDVLDYELPNEAFVLFLYNPFRADVLAGVVSRLERSLESNPRDVTVVYSNPSARHVFDESPAFALVSYGRARRAGNAFAVYRTLAVLPGLDGRRTRG